MFKTAFRVLITGLVSLVGLAGTSVRAQTLTVLYSFKGGKDGAYPSADLTRDQNGTFYSVTSGGGKSSEGTVFKLDSSGKETVLYSFPGFAYGGYPFGKLVIDKEGNLYGTTLSGGGQFAELYGTVFKLSSAGKISNLVVFSGLNGINPFAGLIQDSAGNFYGTTFEGGPHGEGNVYEVTAAGKFKRLSSFGSDPNGPNNPECPLLLDEEGNLYGTTALGGGPALFGTVFKLDKSGNLTTLYRFLGGTLGERPAAGLIRDKDGNLYGTTVGTTNLGPPPHYYGTVFKLDPSGNETALHIFTGGVDGGNPSGGLVRDERGNLYGTTYIGGSSNFGTVFKIDPNGSLTTLYSFTGKADGAYPSTALLLDGRLLYGSASGGGTYNFGTIFRLTLPHEDE